ncbi:MAG: hypothetical protein JWL71_1245 [Acidobacteria bacterium]|nr:hypothetical protein [Acidobacteriota bacterium]
MKVDYTIRPAKNIERKMMCEAFRSLSAFHPIASYRYVGFGSATFNDFRLVHRQLGIADMVSIERDTNSQRRYDFNRPYRCIDVRFGESVDVLPTLDWKKPAIVWLDYECKLTADVLADVECIASNAARGSLLSLSVNVTPVGDAVDSVRELQERVGIENVPLGIKRADLKGWLSADVDCRVVTNKVLETLRDRNAAAAPADRIVFKQIFNFRYADDAQMATFGGVFCRESDKGIIDSCQFDAFEFSRFDTKAYMIEAPILTYRELRHLDRSLPGGFAALKKEKIVPVEDIEKYERVYRYFPAFTESEI